MTKKLFLYLLIGLIFKFENSYIILLYNNFKYFSYYVIANDEPSQAVEKFLSFKTRVLFSAEETCWPDPTLAVSLF